MTASETVTAGSAVRPVPVPVPVDRVGPGPADVDAPAAADVVPRPRTRVGAFLKAIAVNRPAGRDVRPDYDARVFFYCAFELVVRRRFGWNHPVAEIAGAVAAAARRHAPVVVPAIEAEMLIRDALGEAVPIGEISLDAIVTTHLLVFASLVDELALSDDEVDALIVEAEDRAGALGHPPALR